jgi:hypothetical protein
MSLEECMWCKARLPTLDGPTHEYMESTPSCWAAFGRVLAREYSDQAFFGVHRLTVDSYAVQHPGQPSRQSIQSVGVHLVRLCLFLEHQLTPENANAAMTEAAKRKSMYTWLTPPPSLGPLTVADVDAASGVAEHQAVVKRWAEQMWHVWRPHHATVRSWILDGRTE